MKIQKVTDPAFRKYGKVLEGYNFSALLKEMKHTPVPEDVVYVPSVEEHRNSEINVAVTDLVLLIGHQQDVEPDFTYDTSKIEAFLVPAGTGIEVYATTLHYAPCHVNESGFQCVVVLPRGTNTEIDFPMPKDGEDGLMTAKNKWLIAHEDAKIEGAFNGLKGENITID